MFRHKMILFSNKTTKNMLRIPHGFARKLCVFWIRKKRCSFPYCMCGNRLFWRIILSFVLPLLFTHIHALRDELEFQMGQLDVSLLRADGEERGGWLILDFGCVMVHLFVQNMRTFYHLEKLWSDAEPIEPQVLMQSAGVHATENVTTENTAADTVFSDVSADPS